MAGFLLLSNNYLPNQTMYDVEYKVIAEGIDSPAQDDLHIVCMNKYFNLDYLPSTFRLKYNLNDRKLYKKKMLVEIFRNDKAKEGFDKIEIESIKSSYESLVISYNFVNSDTTNDDQELNSFVILQVPESRKKITFIADGVELGKSEKLYVK